MSETRFPTFQRFPKATANRLIKLEVSILPRKGHMVPGDYRMFLSVRNRYGDWDITRAWSVRGSNAYVQRSFSVFSSAVESPQVLQSVGGRLRLYPKGLRTDC